MARDRKTRGQRIRYARSKVHVWAAVGSYAKTKLYIFEENMNSDLYRKILKKMLKEKQLIYASDTPKKLLENWKFLQDNSTVHKSSKSMEAL